MKLTLTNLTTSFQDWKDNRCNKGLHAFNDDAIIDMHYAKPVFICSNCNLKTITK